MYCDHTGNMGLVQAKGNEQLQKVEKFLYGIFQKMTWKQYGTNVEGYRDMRSLVRGRSIHGVWQNEGRVTSDLGRRVPRAAVICLVRAAHGQRPHSGRRRE